MESFVEVALVFKHRRHLDVGLAERGVVLDGALEVFGSAF